jgi:GNAT superfamily N-acetyltransferase
MEIQLIEATDPRYFDLPELRKRAEESQKSRNTTHYCAIAHGREVGFLSLDAWRDTGRMVLYELFIATELRRQGMGSVLLTIVEEMARAEGLRRLTLRPKPLDQGITRQELVEWYLRKGYEWNHESIHEMQKEL